MQAKLERLDSFSGSGLTFDEIEKLGEDFEADEVAQELAIISAYLAKMEEERGKTDDWLVATDPNQIDNNFDKFVYFLIRFNLFQD